MNLIDCLPVEKYGQGKAKTIEHLLKEVESGEAQIIWENSKPIREIRIAAIEIVSEDGECLFEEKQVFSDGRVRERGIWGISEKLKLGEDPREGAIRAMREELGIEIHFIQSDSADEKESESPSYPGLMTRYVINHFTTKINGENYKPEGYLERQNDKTTYFIWKRKKLGEFSLVQLQNFGWVTSTQQSSGNIGWGYKILAYDYQLGCMAFRPSIFSQQMLEDPQTQINLFEKLV